MISRIVSSFKRVVTAIKGAVDVGDVVFVAGLSVFCYGISLVHTPAAWIACGVVLMSYAYMPHFVSFACAIRRASGSGKK